MIEHPPTVTLSKTEYTALSKAKKILENPSFAIKASNYIGRPIEFAIEKIDSKMLNEATSKALRKSLDIAVGTIDTATKTTPSSNLLHKTLVAGSGAVGGFFGLPALALELPVSALSCRTRREIRLMSRLGLPIFSSAFMHNSLSISPV